MTVTQVAVDHQVITVSGSGYSTDGSFAQSTPSLKQLLTI